MERPLCRALPRSAASVRMICSAPAADADANLGAAATLEGESGSGVAWIESPLWRPVARRWLELRAGAPLSRGPCTAGRFPRRKSASESRPRTSHRLPGRARDTCRRGRIFAPGFAFPICLRRAELVDAFDAALAPHRFALYEAQGGRPVCRGGGHAARRLCAGSGRAGAVGRADGPVPFAQIQRPAAGARADESRRGGERRGLPGRGPARRAPTETAAQRVAGARAGGRHALSDCGRSRRCAGWRMPRGLLDDLTGRHPMSRWLSVWIAAFESGSLDPAAPLVERRISIRRTISRAAGDARALRCRLRGSVAILRAERAAASGARHAVSGPDRSSPGLGERAIDGPMARLRRALGGLAATRALGRRRWIPYRCCRCVCSGSTA